MDFSGTVYNRRTNGGAKTHEIETDARNRKKKRIKKIFGSFIFF